MQIKIGDFVKPVKEELKFILDRNWYLVNDIKEYNKNSKMIKLIGHSLFFNSNDFKIINKKGDKI